MLAPLSEGEGGDGTNMAMDWKSIEERCTACGGTVAILLRHYGTGRTLFCRNVDREMPAASTIKVLLLAALLEEGISWEETLAPREEEKVPYSLVSLLDNPVWSVGDLARLMIFDSDNTATNLLLDRLGMDRVNRVGRALGLTGTQFRRKMMDFDAARQGRENVTTLADQALLYETLFAVSRGLALPDAISPADPNGSSERAGMLWGGRKGARKALEILLRVRSDSMLLRYFTEEECLLAHKPGGLPYVRHDAGIFFPGATVASACGDVPGGNAPEDAYFFGVFTTGMPEPEAKELIGRLSRYVYETRKEWLHA